MTQDSKTNENKATPLWRELLIVMFSMPAGLSVVAELNDTLDFSGVLATVVLNYKKVSEGFWTAVSSFFGWDWSYLSDYLSFLLLSTIPVIFAVRAFKSGGARTYLARTEASIKTARAAHDARVLKAELDAEEGFKLRTGMSLRAWQLSKVVPPRPGRAEVWTPEEGGDQAAATKALYARIVAQAYKRRAESDARAAQEGEGVVQEQSPIDLLAAQTSLSLTDKIEASSKERDDEIAKLWRDIYVKLALAVISSLAIFVVFNIVSAVLFALSFALFCFVMWLIFGGFLTQSTTVWDVLAVPMLLVIALIGYGIIVYTTVYFFDVEFGLARLAWVTLLGILVISAFLWVVSFNVFAYLYFCLWALGIYIVHLVGDGLLPFLNGWLEMIIG